LLTNQELTTLKPREKLYKVVDRDGLYVAVLPSGTVSFRYDYRINGRRETLALGRYDVDLARKQAREPEALEYGMGMSLREARTLLDRARRDVEQGVSAPKTWQALRSLLITVLTSGTPTTV
jgi:Arm DNA-binding domain